MQEVDDHDHVVFLHTSRSQGGKAQSDTTGCHGRDVTNDGILVQGNVAQVGQALELGASQGQRSQVPKDQVVLGTIGLELVAEFMEFLASGLRVGNDLAGVLLEGWVGGLLEGDGNTSNGVVVRTTLASREDGSVNLGLNFRLLVLSEEDDTSSRTSQRLVSSRGDNVTVFKGVVLLLGSNETRDVGNVGHQVGAIGLGSLG